MAGYNLKTDGKLFPDGIRANPNVIMANEAANLMAAEAHDTKAATNEAIDKHEAQLFGASRLIPAVAAIGGAPSSQIAVTSMHGKAFASHTHEAQVPQRGLSFAPSLKQPSAR